MSKESAPLDSLDLTVLYASELTLPSVPESGQNSDKVNPRFNPSEGEDAVSLAYDEEGLISRAHEVSVLPAHSREQRLGRIGAGLIAHKLGKEYYSSGTPTPIPGVQPAEQLRTIRSIETD